MEADSAIRFKKTAEKFTDNRDLSDVPATMPNLTNMDVGGVRDENIKKWLGFHALLNSITYSCCPKQNTKLDRPLI